MVDAGRLNQRVEFHRLTTAANPGGLNPTRSRELYAARWARVEQVGGDERDERQGVQTSTHYIIQLRYLDGVLPTDVLVFRGRQLEIESIVDPDSSKRFLKIEAVHHA